MKYIVIVGDGMADWPLDELGGKTPLQAAFTPNLDKLTARGILGMVRTIPEGMHPGSDVANLSILGYNPLEFYSGRAPLEAASIGLQLDIDDVAYRCNLVTLKFNDDKTRAIMQDYSSDHISTEEARQLIEDINKDLGSEKIKFYAGISYRHLMIWSGGPADIECIPPHDILGKDIIDYLPVGNGEDVLREMMINSVGVLEGHPVNKHRIKIGKNPGNSLWFWGQGKKPDIPSFSRKFSINGALISAVDLTRGLGIYAGFEIIYVPGITGYLDTNYKGKAVAAINALNKLDFVYLHVEAPDEAGHSGNYKDKIRAIEDFDALVVGNVMEGMEEFNEYRILVLPDHATPIALRTHSNEPVPFVIFDSRIRMKNEGATYNESILKRNDIIVFEEGYKLMDYFIRGDKL